MGTIQMAAPNNVEQARRREAVSRAHLARLAGIAEKTLKRVEEAARNVAPRTKDKILKAFNSLSDKQRSYTFEDLFPNG